MTTTTSSAIYPPDPRSLLPPLLACLPTSAFSSRAPPALPPLITPILRQRLSIFDKSPQAGSWLRLLNWKSEQAAKLTTIVESMNLEAHPVSGELEIQDVGSIQYKRFDSETLHARMQVDEFDLQPVYLWCIAGSDTGPGWLLTELKPLEDEDNAETWYDSIRDAEDAFVHAQEIARAINKSAFVEVTAAEDDDSAYWAAYDMDPGRTPGVSNKPSPAPGQRRNGSITQLPSKLAESEYFARYSSEVQPAMDPYDADEDDGNLPESTLNHHQPRGANDDAHNSSSAAAFPALNGFSNTNGAGFHTTAEDRVSSVPDETDSPPHHPNPRFRSQSSPQSVKMLEAEAERQSQAEIGIKQHISTDFKSLFRLARSAGISREEFERIVRRELEILPMLDTD